jgi:hypothetical protein
LAKFVAGRFNIVRMNEILKGNAGQRLEVPTETVVPSRINENQLTVGSKYAKKVGGSPEEVPEVRNG